MSITPSNKKLLIIFVWKILNNYRTGKEIISPPENEEIICVQQNIKNLVTSVIYIQEYQSQNKDCTNVQYHQVKLINNRNIFYYIYS